MHINKQFLLPFLMIALFSANAHATLNILTCEPEWAALSQELGGKLVTTYSATTASQDPHHIQARPSLISKVRQADLLICSGADLEVGWLPVLLRKSGNSRVQPGKKGYFMATKSVKLLDKPSTPDRSMGDVHAAGNPHIQLDPRRMAIVAKKLAKRLQQIDPEHAANYKNNLKSFEMRWKKAIKQWQEKTRNLRGKTIIVQHNSWIYLQQWLKLEKIAELEPKPGVPPSSGHLSKILKLMQQTPADLIIYSSYQNPKAADWLSKKTGIKAIELPSTVNKNESLFQWMERLTQRLVDNIS